MTLGIYFINLNITKTLDYLGVVFRLLVTILW